MQEKNIFPKEIDGVLNPWLDVADRIQGNPSCALFYQGDPNYFVASLGKDGHDIKDEDELITYKLPSSKNDEYNLITCIPPEPWQGNPLEAKLVILTLNPGYVEKQNHILADSIQNTEGINSSIADFKAQTLRLEAKSFLPENSNKDGGLSPADYINIIGDWYWYKKFTPLMEKLQGDLNEKEFFRNVAIIQYLPYTSISYKDKKYKGIGSLEYTKKLVLEILEKKENNIVLVLRGSSKWEALLQDEYDLKTSNKVIINKNRSQSISPSNLGEENFENICKILRNNE